MDVEERHRGSVLGSSRECDAEEHVPRDRDQTNREVQEWKRVQGTRRKRTSRSTGSRSCPSGPLRDSRARARGRFADVRRPLVSASHIIQAGNDLFIGKDEAYIMNRKKKEKSMLRKEGNVYVLDLFVRVPSSLAAPVTYTPTEVDAINQIADGRERGMRVTFDCSSPAF